MARETSIAVWQQICNTLVPNIRRRIYQIMVDHPEIENWTGNEIAEYMSVRQRNGISPRLTELRKRDLVDEMPKRVCRVSGRECITFCVSGRPEQEPTMERCPHCGAAEGHWNATYAIPEETRDLS